MKKMLSLVLSIAMIIGLLPAVPFSLQVHAKVPSGYTEVKSIEDLYSIRYSLDGKYYLTSDLDLTEATAPGGDWDNGYGWAPIGENKDLAFTGEFDGNGHTIKGMQITDIETEYVGLFGYVTGTVKNLTFKNAMISAHGCSYVGVLAGSMTGTTQNLLFKDVRLEAIVCSGAGVLAGSMIGTIQDVTIENAVIVASCSCIGTLAGESSGELSNNTIKNTSVRGGAKYVGGIIGLFADGTISNSDVTGCINVTGHTSSGNCFAGGIVGFNSAAINECYSTAEVSIYTDYPAIEVNCYAYAGGIAGYCSSSGTVDSCYNSGAIKSKTSDEGYQVIHGYNVYFYYTYSVAGGICGNGGSIVGCINTGGVSNEGKTSFLSALTAGESANSYYLIGTASTGRSGYSDTAATAVALSAAQMKLQSCFGLLDFNNIWFIDTATGINHPQLRCNPEMLAESISIATPADKLTYYHHSPLDLSGLTITVKYPGITKTSKVTVNENMISGFDSESLGSQTITIHYLGCTTTYQVKVIALPVSDVMLDRSSVTLDIKNSATLQATASPDNATDKTITWSSDDTSVATVDNNGKVTAIAKGTAIITAKAASGKKATCTVTVLVPATGITINKSKVTINKGDTLALSASMTPANTTDSFTWKTGDASIATISETGVITAVGKGTTNITVTTSRGISYSCEVTVRVKAENVTLDVTTKCINAGDSFILLATMQPAETDDEITWSSSNETVAKVTSAGRVIAVAKGTATITATTTSGKTATCTVTVLLPATKIQLDKTSLALDVTKTAKLTATLTPSDSTDKVTYTSSNSSVATVSSDGTVTAKTKGTATITATSTSGKTATCTVTVLVPSTGVSLNKSTLTLDVTKTSKLTSSLTPSNSTDTVQFTSSNSTIATVSSDGTVTAKAKGTATITATTTSGKTATCTVTVLQPATCIQLNKTSLSLNVRTTAKLTVTLTPSNTTDMVSYSSSDSSVATVSSDGTVTAKAKGTATITAAATSGKTATCTVTVLVPSTGVSLNKSTLTLDVMKTSKLTASLTPSNSTDTVQYISSNTTIATVSSDGTVTAKAKGTATITATTTSGKTATCTVTVLQPATGIQLNKTSLSLNVKTTAKLTVTLTPSNTTDTVSYSSSDSSVATVSSDGTITAKARGTATITATATSGKSATCTVTVLVPATGIQLNKSSTKIYTGETVSLTASLTPADSTDTVTWTSSAPKIVSVSFDGVATAKAKGTATITAATTSGKTAVCEITALVAATSITLSKTSLTMNKGETEVLTATLKPSDTTDTVSWKSDDPSVVSVSSDGKLTAKAKGSATITATATNGKSASCTVTVLVPSTGISLNNTSLTLDVNNTAKLTATLMPTDTTDTVSYTSSDSAVAAVSSDGTVTAKAKGTATITATTTSGKTATCTVTVLVPATGLQLNNTSLTLNVSKTAKLTATLTPSDTTDTIEFTSSNSTVAAVSSDGTVTAKATGTATITATATSGQTAECTVTVVIPATKIQLNKTSLTLDVTKTAQLTATLTPSNTTDTVSYTSSNSDVAVVSSDGTVTAKAKGTVTITATTTSGKSATCTVTVFVPATGVQLNNTSLTLNVSKTAELTATLTPADSTDSVVWSSSNDKVVSVEKNGTVTGVAVGTATITAKTDSGKSASCTVTVTPKKVPAQSVSLNKVSLTLKAGQTATLTAAMTPSNSTDSLDWSSSDSSVASVSNGIVTANKAGAATITVTTESGKKASCNVTVSAVTPQPTEKWTQSNQFWFANSSEHFRTGRYTISQSDLLKLNEYIKKNYSSGYAQCIINGITAERNSNWGGSCFGMAMASILDYTGQIGFNENFDKGKQTLHDVSSPSTNSEVQSAINYYFMAQFIPMTRNANESYQKGTSAWSSGLKRLVNKAKDNQIMLFCYFFSRGGHAIVIKGYNGTDSLGNHLISAYDNRYPNKDVIVKISADYSSCIVNGAEYATAIEYLSDFDAYDKIDIDGPNNDLIIQSAINASEEQIRQGTEISVVADGDLMIQNKEGKNIVIKDGIITSTLDVISTHLIVHSTPEGDAAPPEIVFTVADSDYFTFESSAGTLSASMLTAETFSCVTAKNADSAILSAAEGVSVLGDNSEYTVFSSVDDDGCDMFSFSGVANGSTNVQYENGSIMVSGNTPGVITAGKYNNDEYEEFSFNSTKKTVSIQLIETTDTPVLGDVDSDGSISSADARLALRASVKLENYAEGSKEFIASDVNKDGKIGSDDARLILRASVKLEDPKKW